MNSRDARRLMQEWLRSVDGAGEREVVQSRLGVELGDGIPVPAVKVGDRDGTPHDVYFRLERALLPSGQLQLTLTAPKRGERAHVAQLWLRGPDRRRGGTAWVAVPVNRQVEDGRIAITLPERAVENAPTDLLHAVPESLEVTLSPVMERILNAVADQLQKVTPAPIVLRVPPWSLLPAGDLWPDAFAPARSCCRFGMSLNVERAVASRLSLKALSNERVRSCLVSPHIGRDEEPAETHQLEFDGIKAHWTTRSGRIEELSFEGRGDEDLGRIVSFTIRGDTGDAPMILRAYAVLATSPRSDKPRAVFRLAGGELAGLSSEPVAIDAEPSLESIDLLGIQWATGHAVGQELKDALEALAEQVAESLDDDSVALVRPVVFAYQQQHRPSDLPAQLDGESEDARPGR